MRDVASRSDRAACPTRLPLIVGAIALAASGSAHAATPVAVPDTYATTADVTLDITAPGLLHNDYDADADALAIATIHPPAHGTLTPTGSGGFSYQPDPDFVGTDSFGYLVLDSGFNFSNPAAVSIDVLPDPNRPPDASSDAYSVLAGGTLVVSAPGLLRNDTDPDGDPLTLASHVPPSNGQITTMQASGAFVYEPDPGFTGTDTFTYIAHDDVGLPSTTVTVTIEVVPTGGTVPTGMPDFYTVVEDGSLVVPDPGWLANDLDPAGASLSVLSYGVPANGDVTSIMSTGGFTYEPDPGFIGTETFAYSGHNASVLYGPVTVTVEVRPDPNRPPHSVADAYGTLVDTARVVAAPGPLRNDLDFDGDTLSVVAYSSPSHGTLTAFATDGSFTYVPDPGFVGVDSFGYTSTDGIAAAPAPVEVRIFVPEPGTGLGLAAGGLMLVWIARRRNDQPRLRLPVR